MKVSLLYRGRWVNFKSFCNIPYYTEGVGQISTVFYYSLLYRGRWVNFKSFCNIPYYTEGVG